MLDGVNNKRDLELFLSNTIVELKKGDKWLTHSCTLITKNHLLTRLVKKVLSWFSQDRFSDIRVDKVALQLSNSCSSTKIKPFIDLKTANQACEILDFLFKKTSQSSQSLTYFNAVSVAKTKIIELVQPTVETKSLFPKTQLKKISIVYDPMGKLKIEEQLTQLEEQIESVEEITLNFIALTSEQEKRLTTFIKKAPNLKKVYLSSRSCKEEQTMKAIATRKGLIEISLIGQDPYLDLLAKNSGTIEKISLILGSSAELYGLTPKGIEALASFPKLKSLAILEPPKLIQKQKLQAIANVISQLPHLETFETAADHNQESAFSLLAALALSIKKETKITKLKLHLPSQDFFDPLITLAEKGVGLTILSIMDYKIEDLGLLPIFSCFPLEKLKFIGGPAFDSKELAWFETLQTLKELVIHYPTGEAVINDIKKLVSALPKLKKITFICTGSNKIEPLKQLKKELSCQIEIKQP